MPINLIINRYRPTPRDQQLLPFTLLHFQQSIQLNALNVAAVFVNATDLLAIIDTAFIRGFTAGATTVTALALSLDPPTGGSSILIDRTLPLVVASNRLVPASPFVMPPNFTLRCSATFGLADPTNQAELHITGQQVPRGNFGI